jgi:hypothetical protein
VHDRRVPFSQVAAAVDKVNALYEKGGCVFHAVIVPKKGPTGDTRHVVVIEGARSAIDVDKSLSSDSVRRRRR